LDPGGGGLGAGATGGTGAAAFAAIGATSAIVKAQAMAVNAVVVILDIVYLLVTGFWSMSARRCRREDQ
jgi:hypothetical protein